MAQRTAYENLQVFTERTQIFTINSFDSRKWIFGISNSPQTFFNCYWPFYYWIHCLEPKGPKFIDLDIPEDNLCFSILPLGSCPSHHHLCRGSVHSNQNTSTAEKPAFTFLRAKDFIEDVLTVSRHLLEESTPQSQALPSLHLLDNLLQLRQLLLEGSNHPGIIWYRHIKLL